MRPSFTLSLLQRITEVRLVSNFYFVIGKKKMAREKMARDMVLLPK